VKFVDEHRDQFGVAPICAVLAEHGLSIAPSTYYETRTRGPSRRALRDQDLLTHIRRVHADNYRVYGPRKVWLALNREGIEVARCTIERLMREIGLRGARRGKAWTTTTPDPTAERPADLVERRFAPHAPNRLWVADFTYVPTWSGMVYVSFVIDAYARRILGWRTATSMKTDLVLDTIEHAIWTRNHDGIHDLAGLIHHTDAGSQYTSIAFTERLAAEGVDASVGSVGDAYDNALAESVIGLFKTEVIRRRGPWRGLEHVEVETMRWVDWFNHDRLLEANGDLPPVELEQAYYRRYPQLVPSG